MEKSLTYSDITRHTQESSINQKTVWRKDYDCSLEIYCDPPILRIKSEHWLSPNSDDEEKLAGTPFRVRGVESWDVQGTPMTISDTCRSQLDTPEISHILDE